MKHYVRNHAVNPINPTRRIAGLDIAPDQQRGIADDAFTGRYVNLLTTLGDIGKRARLGVSINGDDRTGRFTFDVLPRQDRTASQDTNMPLVMRLQNAGMTGTATSEEAGQSRNVFYCSRAGDQFAWETLTQTYWLDDTPTTGYARREESLSISVYDAGDQYEELKINAKKEMERYRPALSVTCDMPARMEYGRDYELGDYATVVDTEAGIRADMEIVDVQITDQDQAKVTVTFGEPVISRIDKIKR